MDTLSKIVALIFIPSTIKERFKQLLAKNPKVEMLDYVYSIY